MATESEWAHDKHRFVSRWGERDAVRAGNAGSVADDRSALWSPLARQFADIGRELFGPRDLAEVMHRIVSAAERTVLGSQLVSLTVRGRKRGLRSVSYTGAHARELDELQDFYREGPFKDATRSDGTGMAISANIPDEAAWPKFGPRAAEHGVRSVLCVGIFPVGAEDRVGALNMYSDEPRGLAAANPDVGLVLASYAATVLGSTRASTEDELRAAAIGEPLRSSVAIERAVDVLTRKRYLPAEDAYDVLRRASGQVLAGWLE